MSADPNATPAPHRLTPDPEQPWTLVEHKPWSDDDLRALGNMSSFALLVYGEQGYSIHGRWMTTLLATRAKLAEAEARYDTELARRMAACDAFNERTEKLQAAESRVAALTSSMEKAAKSCRRQAASAASEKHAALIGAAQVLESLLALSPSQDAKPTTNEGAKP